MVLKVQKVRIVGVDHIPNCFSSAAKLSKQTDVYKRRQKLQQKLFVVL